MEEKLQGSLSDRTTIADLFTRGPPPLNSQYAVLHHRARDPTQALFHGSSCSQDLPHQVFASPSANLEPWNMKLMEPIVGNAPGPSLMEDGFNVINENAGLSQSVLSPPSSCNLDFVPENNQITLFQSLAAENAGSEISSWFSTLARDVYKLHNESVSEFLTKLIDPPMDAPLRCQTQKQNDAVKVVPCSDISEVAINLNVGKRSSVLDSSLNAVVDGSYGNNHSDFGNYDTENVGDYTVEGDKDEDRAIHKKLKSSSPHGNAPKCQADDCSVDLSNAKDYHRRHKVCEWHSKSNRVKVSSMDQRFCQQCSRFHLLLEFDEGKRSCRTRLAGHNERRRKQQPDPFPLLSAENYACINGGSQSFGTSFGLNSLQILNDNMLRAALNEVKMTQSRNLSHLDLGHFLQGRAGMKHNLLPSGSFGAFWMPNHNCKDLRASLTSLPGHLIPDHCPEPSVPGRALSLLSSWGFPNTSYSVPTSLSMIPAPFDAVPIDNQKKSLYSQEVISRSSYFDPNLTKYEEVMNRPHTCSANLDSGTDDPTRHRGMMIDQLHPSTVLNVNFSSTFPSPLLGEAESISDLQPMFNLKQSSFTPFALSHCQIEQKYADQHKFSVLQGQIHGKHSTTSLGNL